MFMKNGAADIGRLIQIGIDNGTRRTIIKGDWEIECAVRVPSDFTLILDSCHLKMAEGVFDNMFVNEHYGTEEGKTVEGTDRNISIIGRGNVILDGGEFNGLSEKTQRKDGMPPVYKNHIILFNNVDGFEIKNLTIHNMSHWAMDFIYCANGIISDINFKADDTCINEDGTVYHGLSEEHYYDMLRKQTDGIDIRRGCHHILIENISGFTGDDTVALTSLYGTVEKDHEVEGLPGDICYIMIKNVVSESMAANVRLLCQSKDENKVSRLHHILVDGVEDISDTTEHLLTHGSYGVHVNDTRMYSGRHATAEEMHDITIRNVRSRADHALGIAGNPIKNFQYENIVAFDGANCIQDLTIK